MKSVGLKFLPICRAWVLNPSSFQHLLSKVIVMPEYGKKLRARRDTIFP